MKTILCPMIFLLLSQFSFAELKQVKVLNPDGTPAVDAKAVAIMTAGARVDEDLKELPSLVAVLSAPAIEPAKNDSGTISFDSKAKAIIAQNEVGFVFALANTKVATLKLRPWAMLAIDTAKIPEGLKSPRISVLWQNCFAGNAVRPRIDPNDPFSSLPENPFDASPAAANPESTFDWRFDPIVMWSRTKVDTKATMKVPPGEVSVVLAKGDLGSASALSPIPRVLFRPIRTQSKSLATFELPSFGSALGKVSPQLDLPNWNQGLDEARYLRATPFNADDIPAEVKKAFTEQDLNALASFYGSARGSQFRNRALPEITTNLAGESDFLFEFIPEGKYTLEIGSTSGNPQSMKYKADTENQPLNFTVSAGVSTKLDEIDPMPKPIYPSTTASNTTATPGDPLAIEALASENLTPRDSQVVIDAAVKRAEQKIAQALVKVVNGVDYQATPLRYVMQELEDACGIPIRFNYSELSSIASDVETPVTIFLPAMTLRSALRNTLSSISKDLTFTVRDEVLLITSKADAAKGEAESGNRTTNNDNKLETAKETQLDADKTFIEQWLKSYTNEKEPQALRKALQTHLEQEFDANQKSRQTELERLRALLKKSEDWVATRQTQRAEIVRKRMEELLKQSDQRFPVRP